MGMVRPTIQEQMARKHNLAYITTTKMHNLYLTKIVYKQAIETSIMLIYRELLSLTPEV